LSFFLVNQSLYLPLTIGNLAKNFFTECRLTPTISAYIKQLDISVELANELFVLGARKKEEILLRISLLSAD
jgi:hypothetical protein